MAVDEAKLMDFLGTFVGDLGATAAAGSVVLGDQLGLYRGLLAGPATGSELAERTGTDPRYVTEWARGQAAGGYISHDRNSERFSLTEEQAFALTNPDGAAFLPGAFQLALGALRATPKIAEGFRTGAGLGWGEQDVDVMLGCERFFRPGYLANLVPSWIPALEGVQDKLVDGARVADIGCGLGASTVLLAQAFPTSSFAGSDYHQASIDEARKRASDAGVAHRVSFEVASAQNFSGAGYDLVASFDCLHDIGDPVGAARHVREALTGDGTWLIVEPFAGRRAGREPKPRRPALLFLLHSPVRPQRQVTARRSGPGRSGRRVRDPVDRLAGGLHQVPSRRRDALQPGFRGAALARRSRRLPWGGAACATGVGAVPVSVNNQALVQFRAPACQGSEILISLPPATVGGRQPDPTPACASCQAGMWTSESAVIAI